MRALFAGEVVDHDGLVRVDRAKLWTLPAEPPALVGAAVSEETARGCGEWADGMVTINQPREKLERMIAAFREGGGEGKPIYLQVHLSWAPDEEEALAIAYDQWRTNLFQPPLCWDLHTVEQFDEAARHVRPEDLHAGVLISADTGRHAAWLAELAELGFDADHAPPRRAGPLALHRRVRLPRAPGAGGMSPVGGGKATSDLWWKNAVVYCLDVESFHDADGDGCGDLTGLCERIDYLAGLGISCVWLMPFYPSAQRDDGYDITDYYGVDRRLGTHGDLVELVRTARDRGIRVIADLVPNHTSVEHPWFVAAREGRDNPYHDFYVWVDEKPEEKPGDVVFPDQENSNWAYDRHVRQWYLHRFYSHQPDLNVANPEVRDEIAQVVGFWLEQGLSGFRLDAVPFLVEPMGMPEGAIEDPHELLRDLRAFMARRSGEAILLGEVNLPPADAARFFGARGGEELDLLFAFPVNQAMYLSLARGVGGAAGAGAARAPADPRRVPVGALRPQPRRVDAGQAQRRRAGGGLRRVRAGAGAADVRARAAAAAALDARRRRRADADGLLADVLAARDAGALLRRGDRDGGEPGDRGALCGARADAVVVRGRRRLHGARCGACAPARSTEGPFAFPRVNVAAQRRDPESLLSWIERLIRRRRECPELGWGAWTLIEQEDEAVFALRADWGESTIVAVHNLAGRDASASLVLEQEGDGDGEDGGGTGRRWSISSAPRICRRARPSRCRRTGIGGTACGGRGSGSRRRQAASCRGELQGRAAGASCGGASVERRGGVSVHLVTCGRSRHEIPARRARARRALVRAPRARRRR